VAIYSIVLLMMGEIVTRNMFSKVIAKKKNAIVSSCWTYFTKGYPLFGRQKSISY